MSIKPSDCIVRIADLIIGEKHLFGNLDTCDVYVPYWDKFMRHVRELAKNRNNLDDFRFDMAQVVLEEELGRFGAVYKQTKNFDNQYIKFKSHKHLTMFVLRWS